MDGAPLQRILVTGATGQIGSELVPALRLRHGGENVVAAGHRKAPPSGLADSGPYETLDILDAAALEAVVAKHRITAIYHLAALLSFVAEQTPLLAWRVNIDGLFNVLEVARRHGCALFHPSSIGAFGPSTPPDMAPQLTIQRPATLYGIGKLTGELLCDYYHHRFGVDSRGLRFPGLISAQTPPGGGTTDYAVDIFRGAAEKGRYVCFLREDTRLEMMYMPDAVRAAMELMAAEPGKLRHRNAYNITAMNFTPRELAEEIRRHIPDFIMEYAVDPVRQAIADSWPRRLDDSAAREDWGWRPRHGLAAMTREMLAETGGKT